MLPDVVSTDEEQMGGFTRATLSSIAPIAPIDDFVEICLSKQQGLGRIGGQG